MADHGDTAPVDTGEAGGMSNSSQVPYLTQLDGWLCHSLRRWGTLEGNGAFEDGGKGGGDHESEFRPGESE